MDFPTDRTGFIVAFDGPFVDLWLERKITQAANASAVQDRSGDPNLYRWILYPLSYGPLSRCFEVRLAFTAARHATSPVQRAVHGTVPVISYGLQLRPITNPTWRHAPGPVNPHALRPTRCIGSSRYVTHQRTLTQGQLDASTSRDS